MGYRRDNAMPIVGAVGALDRQEALRWLLDRHGRSLVASLAPEPANPDDPSAVAVIVEDRKIGYLPVEVAKRYGPMLSSRLSPMTCAAELHGGEWDMPTISVLLDFSPVYAASHA